MSVRVRGMRRRDFGSDLKAAVAVERDAARRLLKCTRLHEKIGCLSSYVPVKMIRAGCV